MGRSRHDTVQVDGDALESWRIKRGLSQKALAELTGCSRRLIQGYEKGEGGTKTNVEKIAKALGITADQLDLSQRHRIAIKPELLPKNNSFDWFMHIYDHFFGFVNDWFLGDLMRPGMLCQSEEDVRQAVQMIMTGSGAYLTDSVESLTSEEASRLTEIATSMSYHDYLEDVMESWRIIPSSIAFAVSDKMRVACFRILPLTHETYEDIRAGRRSIIACNSDHYAFPSSSLFIDALGEVSEKEYPFIEKRTCQTMRVMLLLFAILSQGSKKPLRVLSLAGTPQYERRAEKLAFEPLGIRLPDSDLEIYEMNMKKAALVPVIVRELQRRMAEMSQQSGTSR